MKTHEFINLFKTGKLGKKRTYSGYKVLDGDNCQLLVRSTRRWGVPSGSELLGVYFGGDVCLFSSNFSRIRRIIRDQVSDPKPVITKSVLDENDQHIIESGVIGFDDEKGLMLVELGETPWMFEHDPSISNQWWTWKYNTGTQVSKRVATVAEAEVDIMLPDDQVCRLGRHLQVMPSDYVPVATSKEDAKILVSPPTPFNYGFTLGDCQVQTVYSHGNKGANPLFLRAKVAGSTIATQFKQAVNVYNEAAERFNVKSPGDWEDLTHDDTGTILIDECGSVFIKGHVYNRYNRTNTYTFDTWHKVLGKAKRVRLSQ
jgi:hypothetical protein